MDRDRKVICNIISEMLDNPDDCGIYPTTQAFAKLDKYIKEERLQAIGWMHTEACIFMDRGEDIRKLNISILVDRIERELCVFEEHSRGVFSEDSLIDEYKAFLCYAVKVISRCDDFLEGEKLKDSFLKDERLDRLGITDWLR